MAMLVLERARSSRTWPEEDQDDDDGGGFEVDGDLAAHPERVGKDAGR